MIDQFLDLIPAAFCADSLRDIIPSSMLKVILLKYYGMTVKFKVNGLAVDRLPALYYLPPFCKVDPLNPQNVYVLAFDHVVL